MAEDLGATGEGQAQGKQRCFMAATGVVLLSSGGEEGSAKTAWGLIQEASQPASLGRAPSHMVPESPLAHPQALRPSSTGQ